jgi:heme o synthase
VTAGDLLSLLRPGLSLAVAVSTLVGFVCGSAGLDGRGLAATAGVFLLACASSSLNQYQERARDALMERTRGRPLPMGRISGRGAVLVACVAGLAGASALFFLAAPRAAFIAVVAAAWYNGVYTPLKPKTRHAVFAGAVTGALPPLVGYTAAGGPVAGPCLGLSLFMFVWQVAHFKVLQAMYGADYERAGFPVAKSLGGKRESVVGCAWAAASAAGAGALAALGVVSGKGWVSALAAASVLFLVSFCVFTVRGGGPRHSQALTGSLYGYQGIVFLLLTGNAVFGPA